MSAELQKLLLDIAADLLADANTREAVERLVPDIGVIATRLSSVWPKYSGRLLLLAAKAAI